MPEVKRKKIAILVPNPCNPDYRVIKHAEFLEREGYEVRVYCRWTAGLPFKQTVNNVTYIREPITTWSFVVALIRSLFQRRDKPIKTEKTLEVARQESKKIIEAMKL